MAGAAVTNILRTLLAALLLGASLALFAAVLPDDRVDVLYHRYQGGGLTVDGPAVLVRKNFANKVSVSGKYYVDNVSSASIDVVTQASKYSDKRIEKSLNVSYLRGGTLLSGGYIDSRESDYVSKTFHFNVSQDFFGDLTTFSMGYTRGNNTIMQNGVPDFRQTSLHQEYHLGLSQILTRNLIVDATEEIMVDDGYLSNPYRSYRYASATDAAKDIYHWQTEVFPNARTSSTTALHARYHLPDYRAAVYGDYRYYRDGWDLKSNTFELGYDRALQSGWEFDVHMRYYKQSAVNFYSDLFQRADQFKYMTRDKQLSDMHSFGYGAGITYNMPMRDQNAFVDRLTFNLFLDRMRFYFDDFRDARVKGVVPGTEPKYSYDANIMRFLFTAWY